MNQYEFQSSLKGPVKLAGLFIVVQIVLVLYILLSLFVVFMEGYHKFFPLLGQIAIPILIILVSRSSIEAKSWRETVVKFEVSNDQVLVNYDPFATLREPSIPIPSYIIEKHEVKAVWYSVRRNEVEIHANYIIKIRIPIDEQNRLKTMFQEYFDMKMQIK